MCLCWLLGAFCPAVAAQGGFADATNGVWRGINLAGAEFGAGNLPGVYGKDYIYPEAEDYDHAVSLGMTAVRVPVRWERLRPALKGAFVAAETDRLDNAVAAAEARGLLFILDIHNYGRFRDRTVEDPEVRAGFVDLWRRLARRYRSSPHVAFGLMNEPHGISAPVWAAVAQETLLAIREEGAQNLVLVPGTHWSGAHSWNSDRPGGSNADSFEGFADPSGNFMYELHQYLDADSSGTHDACVAPGEAARRMKAVTQWLRAQKARGFLGEVGVAGSERCLDALDALLDVVDSAPDAWGGWTWWAGGPWWQDSYRFLLKTSTSPETPQARRLKDRLKNRVAVDQ